MKTKILNGVLIFSLILSIVSCRKNSQVKEGAFYSKSTVTGETASVARSLSAKRVTADYEANLMIPEMAIADDCAEEEFDAGNGANPETGTERKLIKTGNLTIEVQVLSEAEIAVENWCKTYNGYISSTSSSETNAFFTVRVPSEKLEEAMHSFGQIGTVKSHGISTQDVTEQFYDVKTRLSNKYIMRDNLKKYLSQAKDIKDLLQIERELNEVVSEIENMEGHLKRLSNQIDYSTIHISIQLPYGKTDSGFILPDAQNGFMKFISNIISFFVKCLVVFLYIIICGIPVLAIIAFLFWLLFGKIGLLKKLYFRLKK